MTDRTDPVVEARDRLARIADTLARSPRTYSGGKVTLPADIFDDMVEVVLTLDTARDAVPEPSLREAIEAKKAELELLRTDELTDRQHGSLNGQQAALSWVLAALTSKPEPTT